MYLPTYVVGKVVINKYDEIPDFYVFYWYLQ